MVERQSAGGSIGLHAENPALYSIGDPTDEEQLYLEFLNRARLDPPSQGNLFKQARDKFVVGALDVFHVDLDLFATQMAAIAPSQPLAPNAKLQAAARIHTQDMFDHVYQDHLGTDGTFFTDRVTAQGYTWQNVAENVFSFAQNVFHGFGGFEVDWGDDPLNANGGMQNPPGHRNNNHNPALREIGVGVVKGTNSLAALSVGPQLVTEDLATAQGSTPFLTGVAYLDLNSNNLYDLGEGIGGLKVEVAGAKFYAMTVNSGGYAVPVPGNGNYTVTFSGPGLNPTSFSAEVKSNQNVKIDLVPPYVPPAIQGPDEVFINEDTTFTLGTVPGAIDYQWAAGPVLPFSDLEGAENGTNKVILSTTGDYVVIDTNKPAAGRFAFHLAHVEPDPGDQIVQLSHLFLPGTNATLVFDQFLGFATINQQARAEVSKDGGASWTEVWSRVGNSRSDTIYSTITVPLSQFAGQPLVIRFVYAIPGTTYIPTAKVGIGFYLDNIRVQGVEELLSTSVTEVTGTSAFFNPPLQADYFLSARAKVSGRLLPAGPTKRVHAVLGPVRLLISKFTRVNGQAQVEFVVKNPRAETKYQLQTSTDLSSWTTESSATLTTIDPNAKFQFAASTGLPQRFYRVVTAP